MQEKIYSFEIPSKFEFCFLNICLNGEIVEIKIKFINVEMFKLCIIRTLTKKWTKMKK